MNFELTDEQKLLREAVTDFVRRECPPDKIRAHARQSQGHDEECWRRFAAPGWLGIGIDPEYGGSGGTAVDMALVVEASAPAFDVIGPVFPTMCFGGHLIATAGSEDQKREFLPALAAGEVSFSLSLTEPGGGTDVLGAMATRAVRDTQTASPSGTGTQTASPSGTDPNGFAVGHRYPNGFAVGHRCPKGFTVGHRYPNGHRRLGHPREQELHVGRA